MTVNVEAKVLADKALRDSTKRDLDGRLAQVKVDLQARGIAGRIADDVVEKAKVVFDEASDIAQDHPGVIAGTITALVLWLLRNPIIGWLEVLLSPRRKPRR